jgi:hypothetical protein
VAKPGEHSERRTVVRALMCLIGILLVSLLHFVISFALRISLGFSDEEYVPERSALWEIGRITQLILWFPAWWVADTFDVHVWAVLIGNSILWGAALFTLFIAALRLAGIGPIKWTGQFSMRTLLMAITAAAIVLGAISLAIRNLR